MQTKKMRTGKCWFEKGDFDNLGMCIGCFRAHFGPGKTLKQSQHVKMMQTKKMRTGKCWFEKGDFDHFGMCFGCFGAHFGPGGSLKQHQHVKMMRIKKMRTGKCWFDKGDFDHLGSGGGGVVRVIKKHHGSECKRTLWSVVRNTLHHASTYIPLPLKSFQVLAQPLVYIYVYYCI